MRENWQLVKEIFTETLGQKQEFRMQFISQRCSGNQHLEEEVKSLLLSYDSAESFLESPAIAQVADSFTEGISRLESGSFVGHYKIVKRIGKGGMGEVYLAEDTKLERKVAIKILNNFFDSEHINIKRFVLEAKAASSLNHPNIVVIHEVGESHSTHFIVTEYIKGRTLNEVMHSKTLSLKEILDISVQILSALAAAHNLGIIHRDIKPDNIMLREDGIVKILDFGLAKLTDSPAGEIDHDQKTREQMNTRSGMILGTTNYMSPEQARGIAIDTRTDIWSFGVVFYELLTRRLPFEGETTSDIIASVLRAEPAPLSESGNAIPRLLEEITLKSLQKNPADRFQNADELLAELKTFQHELDYRARNETYEFQRDDQVRKEKFTDGAMVRNTDESPFQDFPKSSDSGVSPPPTAYFPKALAWMAIAFAVFSIAGVFAWSKFSSPPAPVISFNNMKISKLTYEGQTNYKTAISPDGKYIAYGLRTEGKVAFMVRQVGNQAGVVEIIPPTLVDYDAIEFSKDGNSIYYIAAKPKSAAELYEIPVLGGTPRKILENLNSFSFSPDGKMIAFVRSGTSLMLADANGENQRVLANSAEGERRDLLAWRPNGKSLMSPIVSSDGKVYLLETSIADGTEKRFSPTPWLTIMGIEWLKDESGIVISGRDLGSQFSQIWFVAYPSGEAQRITNDLDSYFDISITDDGKSIVSTKQHRLYNIWTVPDGKTENAKKITVEEGKDEGIAGLAQASDGKIIYTVRTAGKFDLWSINADGSENRQLTFNQSSNVLPMISHDRKSVYFHSDSSGNRDLWRMNTDGTNLKNLTNSPLDKEDSSSPTPDGKAVLYHKIDSNNQSTIWKMNLETGQSSQLTQTQSYKPQVSPDGKYFSCEYVVNGIEQIAIIPIDGGKPVKILDLPLFTSPKPVRWSSDGKSLIYIDKKTQTHNLWSQPLEGGNAKQLTFFESGQITAFTLGSDGKTFILSRGSESSDIIMVSNFR